MSPRRWIAHRVVAGFVVLSLSAVTPPLVVGQVASPSQMPAGNTAAGFKEFSDRVQAYLKLQKKIEASLPNLRSTDVPELIAAHQQALARKIREARPKARAGDIFTEAACESFRRAALAALAGPNAANSRAYMDTGAPSPNMPLVVNAIYPDTEPRMSLPPELLAAFPPLPDEVAYRIVGRTLILLDVKARLIVDIARAILSPAS